MDHGEQARAGDEAQLVDTRRAGGGQAPVAVLGRGVPRPGEQRCGQASRIADASGPLLETNVISYGWPMFAALALAAAWRTRSALWGLGFALLGFAGVAVMFSDSTSGAGHGPWGHLAALGSALCMAFYTLAITVPRCRWSTSCSSAPASAPH